MSKGAPGRAVAPRWVTWLARAIVVISVRPLPDATARRYLEECEADLAQLQGAGTLAPIEHALWLLYTSRRFAAVVGATPQRYRGGAWVRRALAHFGLATDPRRSDAAANGSYVFAGGLRWRPLQPDEPFDEFEQAD